MSMRGHPTSTRCSPAAADRGLELVAEDEIALTSEAAAVLARIIREHLEQKQPTSESAGARHTAAAH